MYLLVFDFSLEFVFLSIEKLEHKFSGDWTVVEKMARNFS